MKKIIVIETSDIGAKYTSEAAKLLGYEALFLVNLNNYQADTKAQLLECDYIDCDTTSCESLISIIKLNNVENIEGVITFLDSRLTVAVEMAKALRVKGIDESVLNLKDKAYVQNLIPQFSPPSISFNLDEYPENAIEKMKTEFAKIIFKPTLTAGAIGVEIVDREVSSQAIKEKLMNANIPGFLNNKNWLAQAFLQGPLYSVEGFVKNNSVRFLGISDRQKIGKTESQVSFPVDTSIGDELKISMQEALSELVNKSNFKNGYFHVEFIAVENRAYIIDANMGRLGGGSLGAQIAISFECPPEALYAHVIDVAIFGGCLTSDTIFDNERQNTKGFLYGLNKQGTVHHIHLPKLGSCVHLQLLENKSIVPPMGENNWAWLGIVCGPTKSACEVVEKILIETGSGYESAAY
ncbi:MAG: ATP-grasp domain-containing protein [Bdellovibrio sp.]